MFSYWSVYFENKPRAARAYIGLPSIFTKTRRWLKDVTPGAPSETLGN